MEGEAVLADLDAALKTARDHIPADAAFERAQGEDQRELGRERARDAAARPEIKERQGEGEADEPAQQPVEIFPEENALELGQGHAGMDRLVLRDRLVAL